MDSKLNKSEIIRDMLEKNPDIAMSEVREAIESKGLKFQAPQFYTIKNKMSGKGGKKAKKSKKPALATAAAKARTQPASKSSSVAQVLAAHKSLSDAIGNAIDELEGDREGVLELVQRILTTL